MEIPFIKAHGAGNDFLLTWAEKAPAEGLNELARAICHRHTGIGADGWMLLRRDGIRLFNADGGEAELSGNGTRCAAAVLADAGFVSHEVALETGAGEKHLVLKSRHGRRFEFEMDMGLPAYDPEQIRHPLPVRADLQEVTVLNVGNPQCAVFVEVLPEDWIERAAEIEGHPFFPKRTNVSFVRVVDQHTIDVRFYERGVGVTQSSGTGSTGAAVAAILRGYVSSPVRIETVAGDLWLRWDDSVHLTGPAEIVGSGVFFVESAAQSRS